MKILLLTDIPPCHNFTAGLATAQICRALAPGEIASFVVLNRDLNPVPEADLQWIPTSFITKPDEHGRSSVGRFDLGELGVWINETRTRLSQTGRIVNEAVAFGVSQNVDSVWAVLQGQTMVRISHRVAKRLDVPLRTLIWDPLSWWHRARNIDRVNRFLDNRILAQTLKDSVAVAAPSYAMADLITRQYKTPSIPIIASVALDVSQESATGFRDADTITIGMAGQFYALDAWLAFCDALAKNNWMIGGRRVRMKTLGGARPPNPLPDDVISYFGWFEQSDAIKFLAEECDVLYCPYPLAQEMEETARFSFPSKVVIYLAAGRPIYFHGPEYSSPGRYLRQNDAGITCDSLDASDIIAAITPLVENTALYQQTTTNGRRAFLRDFTLDRQAELAREFFAIPARRPTLARWTIKSLRRLSLARTRRQVMQDADKARLISSAFDPWYYQATYPDARDSHKTVLDVFVQAGQTQHRNPNNWFSAQYYATQNPDVVAQGVSPFEHYLRYGWKEGRSPSGWFSVAGYLSNNPDVHEAGLEPAQHYMRLGWREGRDPNPWFSVAHYLSLNPDVRNADREPAEHYATLGWREGRDPGPWFSVAQYLARNPDVRDAGIEPAQHYMAHGWREGRDPNSWFSVAHYLSRNPDIREAGIEPAQHYVTHGWREGRDPSPWFSIDYYLSRNPDVRDAGLEPAQHYVQYGWREGRDPNSWFSVSLYLARNPDVSAAGVEPFQHFLTHGWREGRDFNRRFSTSAYLRRFADVGLGDIIEAVRARMAEAEHAAAEHVRAQSARDQLRLVVHTAPLSRTVEPRRATERSVRESHTAPLDQRDVQFAETLLTKIVIDIQEAIKMRQAEDITVQSEYFYLMDLMSKSINIWLETIVGLKDKDDEL